MGQAGPAYPPAAEHPVAVVEHRRLARRDRTGRRVEDELGLPGARAGAEPCRYPRLRWAKLRRHRHAFGRWRAEPIELAERNSGLGQSSSRTDDDAPPFGLDLQHIERLVGGDPEPFALPDREMGDAIVPAEHPPAAVDDVAWLPGLGPQPLDETGVGSVRHKADVLTVGLVRDRQAEMPRQDTRRVLGELAQWKPQELEFLPLRGKQEIALVARRVACAVEFGPLRAANPAGIMPCRLRRGTEIPRHTQQIAEFDPLIAADARDRRLASRVAVDKIVDDRSPEAALVIEHIMRDAEALGDPRCIVDV